MNGENNSLRRCCFTGHRPEKLTADSEAIKASLSAEIDVAIADGITEFITGMARGVDMWAAELVLARRATNPGVTLFCAIRMRASRKSGRIHGATCTGAYSHRQMAQRYSNPALLMPLSKSAIAGWWITRSG